MDENNMGSLFPEIDEEATIEKVMAFFKVTLPKMIRTSGHTYDELKSPAITDMPKGNSVDNGVERRIAQRLYAEQLVIRTMEAIKHCDNISQIIMNELYVSKTPKYDYQVWEKIGYGQKRYYYYKNRALLFFADSFMLEDLHIYKP